MTDKDKDNVKDPEDMQETASDEAETEAQDSAEESELTALQAQLDEAEARAAENLDGWQRAQAEFANYKKRMARDQEQMYADLRGRILKRYLEVLDDFERALAKRPEEGPEADWVEGIELIYRKLASYLESEGVLRMEIKGKQFDPNLHEAVVNEKSEDHKSGEIIEVLQPGYMLGDRVLRPAVVKVAQ
ncbi:MAG: nucleotide exchange factor GrpE [Chloroflexi bacterium]|nr:nucleotide exchange factor GrpE [Chloroflexota bacterium]